MTALIVVADDLTGAAEIAAIGFRRGWKASVARDPAPVPAAPGLSLRVLDTDSRLASPDEARACLEGLAGALEPFPPGRCFKKVDSVLRGAVATECEALARLRGCDRVLLVPANPGLGRTIRDGRYFVGADPLDATPFADDPHHPADSADVVHLLARSPGLPVASAAPGTRPRPGVLTVGDATARGDLATWAAAVETTVLPAGGAEFFEALLDRWTPGTTPTRPPAAPPPRPALVVLGSIAPASRTWRERAAARGAALHPLPEALLADEPDPTATARWNTAVTADLARRRSVITWVPTRADAPPELPVRARRALAAATARLAPRNAFGHLVVAGGSTAAAILEALGWTELAMAHEWAQGVVSLHPAEAPTFTLTLKPGSYDWPETLDNALF